MLRSVVGELAQAARVVMADFTSMRSLSTCRVNIILFNMMIVTLYRTSEANNTGKFVDLLKKVLLLEVQTVVSKSFMRCAV